MEEFGIKLTPTQKRKATIARRASEIERLQGVRERLLTFLATERILLIAEGCCSEDCDVSIVSKDDECVGIDLSTGA